MNGITKITRMGLIPYARVGVVALMLACSTHTPRPIQSGADSGSKRGTEDGMQGFTDGDKHRVAGCR
jgi:hypothetical protein